MGKTNSNLITEFKVEPERTHFQYMLAKNPNYFGNIPGSKLKPNFKFISNTGYEQLTCIGYNPDTANMEATFAIKRTTGYSGNLCTNGSFEHVRFYLDFHDGLGVIDQGTVSINVHDIPAENDCEKTSIFPIIYVATLKKKTSKLFYCETPVLPTLRVILSWFQEPPADSPDWPPVWGNVMNRDVQLKPSLKIINSIDMSDYLTLAKNSPDLSSKQIADISGIDLNQINSHPEPPGLAELVKKSAKLNVPASRFAFKTVSKMIKYPTSEITMMDKATLSNAKINSDLLIDQFVAAVAIDASKANVDYEELECVGLDYNTESLVATIRIKKECGYSGDLCDAGSKEYVSFWIDWDNSCNWLYLNTMQLTVHDINMPGDSLYYSVSLPLDAAFHRLLCENPNVIRVRGVLSWNVAPSTIDPNKLEYYGNRIDAHIQIKPGDALDPDNPVALFTVIGGIDVDHVDDSTGLTLQGSVFAFNATAVPNEAPFGGVIVINGPSFPGCKYRIKIINLNTGTSYYLNSPLSTVGWSPVPPYSPWFTHNPDPNYYYDFLPSNENLLNVLARFTPGTEDQLKVEMEVQGVVLKFSKTIQMDNTVPKLYLKVDDGGDCTHYSKGDIITGNYSVYDLHISYWTFGTTWGGADSGTSNTPGSNSFTVNTLPDAYPCGGVSLYAIDKTIVNSQWVGHENWAYYNICLKNKV
jgi:hypothetical protein